jgi:hypothetical protein
VELLSHVVGIIKRVSEEIVVILGGPEVSFQADFPEIVDQADYCVTGDGEIVFKQLCTQILDGGRPKDKVIEGGTVDLKKITLPYHLYTDEDIAHRTLYLEASRGCPFGCEFCLSSTDNKVRRFPEDRILEEIRRLFDRGARRFKFVDRTLHLVGTPALLEFFIERQKEGVFVHFEIVPDRLPKELLHLLKKFNKGTLQLEAGVQSFNEEVGRLIGRKQNPDKSEAVLKTLLENTKAHIHSDLVVGLPGETIESFALGFDKLVSIGPDEIQLGILKRLRGAPIKRHEDEWKMVYSPKPPYEILVNKLIDFHTMQRLKRFSRYFDIVFNSGNFASSARFILDGPSPFESFLRFSDWLYKMTGQTSAIALNRLATLIFNYLEKERGVAPNEAANSLYRDFATLGRRSFPGDIMQFVTLRLEVAPSQKQGQTPPRQTRHVTTANLNEQQNDV